MTPPRSDQGCDHHQRGQEHRPLPHRGEDQGRAGGLREQLRGGGGQAEAPRLSPHRAGRARPSHHGGHTPGGLTNK